jgi:tetratricopeptide (TPR) repeat protein
MKTRTATRGVADIKSELMKYYHQLPVTEDNSKAVRAVAWALLANVLISDYLNRWNEAGTGGNLGDNLLTDAETAVGKALNLDDTFALAHYANGLVLRARGRCTEALHAFERAINRDSTFARAHAQKGSELINDGQFDNTLKEKE